MVIAKLIDELEYKKLPPEDILKAISGKRLYADEDKRRTYDERLREKKFTKEDIRMVKLHLQLLCL